MTRHWQKKMQDHCFIKFHYNLKSTLMFYLQPLASLRHKLILHSCPDLSCSFNYKPVRLWQGIATIYNTVLAFILQSVLAGWTTVLLRAYHQPELVGQWLKEQGHFTQPCLGNLAYWNREQNQSAAKRNMCPMGVILDTSDIKPSGLKQEQYDNKHWLNAVYYSICSLKNQFLTVWWHFS